MICISNQLTGFYMRATLAFHALIRNTLPCRAFCKLQLYFLLARNQPLINICRLQRLVECFPCPWWYKKTINHSNNMLNLSSIYYASWCWKFLFWTNNLFYFDLDAIQVYSLSLTAFEGKKYAQRNVYVKISFINY